MKQFISLILCGILLCGCSSANPQIDTQPETTAPQMNTILVYVPNDNADGFETIQISGPELTVFDALVDANVLPGNIQLNSFSIDNDTIEIDFTSELRDLINQQGTAGEYMIMGSIVNTFLTHYQAQYAQITVNGEIWESGHVIYDFPMEFYD